MTDKPTSSAHSFTEGSDEPGGVVSPASSDHPGRAALAVIMEAAEKATPGLWAYGTESIDPEWAVVMTTGGSVMANVNADHRQEANARLICLSRNNIASVAAYVAKLEAERDALRKAGKDALGHIEHMAAFIGSKQLGYSFEALGEDIGDIRDAVGGDNG